MIRHLSKNRPSEMRLYDTQTRRLYINAAERVQFLRVLAGCRDDVRSFGLTLLYTGCRLSEALELTGASLQGEARLLTFRSLKKRDKVQMREVPIPPELVSELSGMVIPRSLSPGGVPRRAAYIWQKHGQKINRATGYRWIKSIMAEAGIVGAQASPKGLRHGYGIHAVRSGVQLNMLQRWMGHTSMSTTAIYANAIGQEELEIADRMWN